MGTEQKEKDELKKDPIKAEPKKHEQGTPDKDQREQKLQEEQENRQRTELAQKPTPEQQSPVVTLNDNKPDGPENDKGPKDAKPDNNMNNGLNSLHNMMGAFLGLEGFSQILGSTNSPGMNMFQGVLAFFGIKADPNITMHGPDGNQLTAQNTLDTRPDLAPGMNNTNKPGLGQGPGGIG